MDGLSSRLAGPGDDMVGPVTGIGFVHHLAAYRLAGLVHGAAVAGDERMPLGQALPFRQQAVGAGRRQPVELGDLVVGDLQAVRLLLEAVDVVGALAGLGIEQVAGHVGEHQLLGVLIDQLVQAALAAAIAQGLPLGHGHLLQAFYLPKGGVLHGFTLLHKNWLTQYTDKRVVIRPMARFFKVNGKIPRRSKDQKQ